MSHILYGNSDGFQTRIICERDNWKTCPEHKHLTDHMPKDFLKAQQDIVQSIENPYASEEQAISGVNQAYYDYKTKTVKRDRTAAILNTVAGVGAAGLVAVGFATGVFVFALPMFAWAGWNVNNMFSKK